MADIFTKITNFLIPEEDVVEEVAAPAKSAKKENAETASVHSSAAVKQVVNGEPLYAPQNASAAERQQQTIDEASRPSFKVYKQPNMNILVFEPSDFNDTRLAADSLKASKAVIMNYEKVEYSEQVRICDFMNGACYVLDGSVKRISANMVLYVPSGVSIEEIMAVKA